MEDRRLSRLPIPVTGFKKTKTIATFTASPLVDSYDRLDLNDENCGSPAKKIKSHTSKFPATSPGPRPQSHEMTVDGAAADNRRYSLISRRDSLLATPPLRRVAAPRKSIAPNPYGIHLGQDGGRRRSLGDNSERIVVCVRKRPLSQKEAMGSNTDSVACDEMDGVVSVNALRTKLDGLSKFEEQHSFRFDRVFDEAADNEHVYQDMLSPLVNGQTGSGKTHTMFHEAFGLVYQAAKELFDLIQDSSVDVHVSFYEIYQGQLMDLLRNKRRIVACERDGVINILGLEEEKVHCVEELVEIVKRGLATRVTGSTGANAQSSRSHAVLQYNLRPHAEPSGLYGRLSFIDLAGSERGADRATVNKQTKLEGSEINKSLLALKECIRAMDLDSSRIPFRQSKLTMVLRDCFLGNSRTCMIATVSPASGNIEHTLNTLRYADRMKETQGSSGVVTGEVVTQYDVEEQPTVKQSFVKRMVTPEPVLYSPARSQSESSINGTKLRLRKTLESFGQLVNSCTNPDMLDLLEEELNNLQTAFNSLS